MERPIFQPAGTLVEDLDTPALVVDLAAMDANIETMHSYFRLCSAKLRPHVASHQCPEIARRQMAAGGTVSGVCVTTLGEAEVFILAGFQDITVASPIVTRSKISRLLALAARNRVSVAVDNPQNVADLSEAAQAAGVNLEVLVELDAGRGQCGVPPGTQALDLAGLASRFAGITFEGLMAALPAPNVGTANGDGLSQSDRAALDAGTRQALQLILDTRELIENDGLEVLVVSVSGTHCYQIAGNSDGVTEVRAGAYPLMDYGSCLVRPEFAQAAKVLAQVISHPVDNRAVLDAGHKSTGPDLGVPVLEGFPGAKATRFSAEHGSLELTGDAINQLKPGDKAWLLPFNLGLCVNQYDYIRAVRGGKLEGFWPLSGRGQFS